MIVATSDHVQPDLINKINDHRQRANKSFNMGKDLSEKIIINAEDCTTPRTINNTK